MAHLVSKALEMVRRASVRIAALSVVTMLALSPASAQAAGQVIVNEFMANPVTITDADGEWVELFNSGDASVNLQGWELDNATISQSLVIPPQQFLLICRESDSTQNGGLNCDYELTGLSLTNSGGTLALEDDSGTTVDSFTYANSDVEAGQSTIVKRFTDPVSFGQDNRNQYESSGPNTGTPGSANPTSVLDIVQSTGDLSSLAGAVAALAGVDCSSPSVLANLNSTATAFAPNNAAFADVPAAELNELTANLDELCELINYHVHAGSAITSNAITAATIINTLSGDDLVSAVGDDTLVVNRTGAVVTVDQATVVLADVLATNGVAHVINQVLLPVNPLVDINPVVTNSTSPELSGTYSTTAATQFGGACILVRVNGIPHVATVNGDGTWTVPAGMVAFDPNGTTLFSVVFRNQVNGNCVAPQAPQVGATLNNPGRNRNGNQLLALTMRVTQAPPADNGSVLGDSAATPAPQNGVVLAASTCGKGKGGCPSDLVAQGDQAGDNGAADDGETDGTDGQDDSTDGQDGTGDDNGDDDSSLAWVWWLVGGAVVVGLWYVLWRGPGEESSE